jgi:hypothetical protein
MGDEKDMFVGLGWKKEIRSREHPHVPFNPSPKHDINARNQYSDDYELTSFFQSIQAWRWTIQDEQRYYVKNEKKRAEVLEKDVTRCMNSEIDDVA